MAGRGAGWLLGQRKGLPLEEYVDSYTHTKTHPGRTYDLNMSKCTEYRQKAAACLCVCVSPPFVTDCLGITVFARMSLIFVDRGVLLGSVQCMDRHVLRPYAFPQGGERANRRHLSNLLSHDEEERKGCSWGADGCSAPRTHGGAGRGEGEGVLERAGELR